MLCSWQWFPFYSMWVLVKCKTSDLQARSDPGWQHFTLQSWCSMQLNPQSNVCLCLFHGYRCLFHGYRSVFLLKRMLIGCELLLSLCCSHRRIFKKWNEIFKTLLFRVQLLLKALSCLSWRRISCNIYEPSFDCTMSNNMESIIKPMLRMMTIITRVID